MKICTFCGKPATKKILFGEIDYAYCNDCSDIAQEAYKSNDNTDLKKFINNIRKNNNLPMLTGFLSGGHKDISRVDPGAIIDWSSNERIY